MMNLGMFDPYQFGPGYALPYNPAEAGWAATPNNVMNPNRVPMPTGQNAGIGKTPKGMKKPVDPKMGLLSKLGMGMMAAGARRPINQPRPSLFSMFGG